MNDVVKDGFRTLGPVSGIRDGFVVPFYLRDVKRRVSVARVGDELFGFDDLCTCLPQSCPLSGGLLQGKSIMCQCHGSRFDVETGAVLEGPASIPLRTYEVREIDGEVQLRD